MEVVPRAWLSSLANPEYSTALSKNTINRIPKNANILINNDNSLFLYVE